MKRLLLIGIAIIAVAAGAIWWATPSTAEVEFELRLSSDNGCIGTYPGLGVVSGSTELVLRDNDNKKVATISLYESAASNKLTCSMIGIAEIPVLDVYRAEVNNFGRVIDAGLVDRDQVESGRVRISNP